MMESWVHREGVSQGRAVGREDDFGLKAKVGNSQVTDKKFSNWIMRKIKETLKRSIIAKDSREGEKRD